MDQVNDLVAYWQQHPPTHLCVAAAFEINSKTENPEADSSPTTEEEIHQLVAMFGRG